VDVLAKAMKLTSTGVEFEQFAVGLNLASFPEATQFVAREKELSKMHELLHGHNSRSCVVIHGLGGMGKTQLAITYAKRHKEKYTAIFWLNANDENSLKLGFWDVAQQVLENHPSTSMLASVDLSGNFDQVVKAVHAWLDIKKNTRWLMIYDNYDNPKTAENTDSSAVDIRRFLPRSDHGSIIITTRWAQVSQGQRIHVEKLLNIQEGLEILSNTSGQRGIDDDLDAIELVKELDGLPLALSTAGAYLEHVTTSFSEYLRLYKASWLKLQSTSPRLSSYEDRSLYTTWQITFDRIQQQNAASAKLLKLWAYFDRQDVWFELLQHANSSDEWIKKLTQDELNFNKAVALLCSFGLVDPDRSLQRKFGSGGYSVHSCVHSWMVFVLNKEWDESLARLAITCVASNIPMRDERNSWILQQRHLQHATRQEQLIKDGKVDTKGIEWALYGLGLLYLVQGKRAEAEKMFILALQGCEEALGPDHMLTLDTVSSLGSLYSEQGKLAEAEKMYNRALQGKEKALGPNHKLMFNTINNLGGLYSDQGKLAEAEKMYNRALQGKEEALGLDHISTLNTVNNLGLLYANQGKLDEAEKMLIRALRGCEETLGPDHPSTLDTVTNLGGLYADQGKLVEAEMMYTRALQGCEEALGPKHTLTLYVQCGLGDLYRMQQKPAEAEKTTRRALNGFEETLGPKHPLTLEAVNNLGRLFADQGKLVDAEPLYTRALQGYEALDSVNLASYTPALKTILNLGNLFSETKRLDMAKTTYTRALSGYRFVQGPSSKRCRRIEDRLQALQFASVELEAGRDKSTEIGAQRLGTLKQKLRNLGRRLNIR
jgi:tetratricopeptide (TPR) repeat protein